MGCVKCSGGATRNMLTLPLKTATCQRFCYTGDGGSVELDMKVLAVIAGGHVILKVMWLISKHKKKLAFNMSANWFLVQTLFSQNWTLQFERGVPEVHYLIIGTIRFY